MTSIGIQVMPAIARWLPTGIPNLQRLIVVRAHVDVGLTETPPGSNRHPVIDGYARMFGSPPGSSWCALAAGAWFAFAGARLPDRDVGAVASWYVMGSERGTLTQTPQPGYAVIYDLKGDGVPDHMGIIASASPLVLTIEGNTTYKRQSGNDRNGEGCTLGDVDAAHVLAYLIPEATPTPVTRGVA